jgi:type II secretory pathway component GspD/PulD (secretin)
VSFSSAGQQSSVTPEDIGIILTVKPSINPEGFVRMQIEPEISRLSLQTTQISENFNSPVVTRRRATTTVTVKDGQTVVIGGLISDRFERVDRKVPLLGDIPLVGSLFRQYRENSSKTELLIVLTPHVVRSPTENAGGTTATGLTEQGVDSLSLPASLLEQIRRGQLEGKGQIEGDTPSNAPSEKQR